MGKTMRTTTLASAIGVALLGASFSPQAVIAASANQLDVQQSFTTTADINAVESYFIRFTETGLLAYEGGLSGMAPTSPKAAGTRKLDVHSPASVAYGQYLQIQRNAHVSAIESVLGKPLDVTHDYAITMNAVAANITAADAALIVALPGVASVKPAGEEHLATYRSASFIGADTIWDGSNTPDEVGTLGQGILIADLDTGANSTHPSFANDPACGFNSSNPKLEAVDCSTSSGGLCNGPNPEAAPGNGHGVHTAGTAAGNTIDNMVTPAPDLPNGVSMSGIAPCASIKSYKVCQTTSCGGADIAAGIENAIADNADVLNFSISGGLSPWLDNDRDFLDAVNADVFVAAAAGNTTATITDPVGQVNHRGPWVMTVAASTQDLVIGPGLKVTGPGTVPAILDGIALNPGSTTDPGTLVDMLGLDLRVDPDNLLGCTDDGGFTANYFDNAVAVIQRGICPFTEKINNAAGAGAEMVIIANNTFGSINMDTTGAASVPAFSIVQAKGDALIAFIIDPGANPDPDIIFQGDFEEPAPPPTGEATGDYLRISVNSTQGDVLADFSFRGPTPAPLTDLTKPNIAAPGVDIYAAATASEGNYAFYSGTSMATPQITGAAALMRAVHPGWTIQEVKSALQMTAKSSGYQEDGSTSWNTDDVGSGRVDLNKAALSGLTLDETYANFVAANPTGGTIDVKDLNIPSVRNVTCADTGCSWTRTVKNQLSTSGTWTTTGAGDGFSLTVQPGQFTLAPGATRTVTITAVPDTGNADLSFGNVSFSENSGLSPDQHITAAVKSGTGGPPVDNGGVDCSAGDCDLQVDTLPPSGGNFSGIGCTAWCGMIWLNRFTPDLTDYPIRLTSVSTIFASQAGWNSPGDKISIFVYQDDDDDPSNGATPVGSPQVYTIGTPVNSFVTIPLSPPIVVNGPGDIIIALSNPYASNVGARPASADSGPYAERSWIGDNASSTTHPDLSSTSVGLLENPDAIPGFVGNWLIRATGQNASLQDIELDASK